MIQIRYKINLIYIYNIPSKKLLNEKLFAHLTFTGANSNLLLEDLKLLADSFDVDL